MPSGVFLRLYTNFHWSVFLRNGYIIKYCACNKPLQFLKFYCAQKVYVLILYYYFWEKHWTFYACFAHRYRSFKSFDTVTSCGSHLLVSVSICFCTVCFSSHCVILPCYYLNQFCTMPTETKQTREWKLFSASEVMSSKRSNVGENVGTSFVPSSMIVWLMYHVSLVLHFDCWWWVIM